MSEASHEELITQLYADLTAAVATVSDTIPLGPVGDSDKSKMGLILKTLNFVYMPYCVGYTPDLESTLGLRNDLDKDNYMLATAIWNSRTGASEDITFPFTPNID